jgi:hypothetical protein
MITLRRVACRETLASMSARNVIARVALGASHTPTGATIHRAGDRTLPSPAALEIVQFAGDPGFVLLYLDRDSNEITDTYHGSLEAAFEQAKCEFNVSETAWSMNEG